MASIEEKVTNLVEPIIEKIGYELYDVEYAKEGKNYFLRIFIDSEKGIDLNDCEKVNDAITDILDTENYIKDQYFLEISSPGIERVLRKDKHLEKNIGTDINVKLFKKDENGKKEYKGTLESNLKNLEIANQGGIVVFRYANDKVAEYTSNDEVINHNELLKKANVNEEDLKGKISFDFTIVTESGKEYKANMSFDLPVNGVVENGTTSQEITDVSNIIFKRTKN